MKVTGWQTTTAAQIADVLNAPVAMEPCNLRTMQKEVAANLPKPELPAVLAEMANLLNVFPEWIRRVEDGLAEGDLDGVMGLKAFPPTQFSATLDNAINLFVADRAQTLIGIQQPILLVDDGQNEEWWEPPAAVTADAVTAALEKAGFAWSGSQWE